MMNCCNDYGQCVQGKDCAARTSCASIQPPAKVAPHHRRSCTELGVCQGRGDCTCSHPAPEDRPLQDTIPPEAGNMSIVYLGDDDGEWDAVTLGDIWRWLRPTLPVLGCVLLVVGVAGVGTGYVTEHHADLLWTFLQGVS